ncbi:MAG: Crp/Fnr family transcriptional regulator [Alphaproteobacteria bacterium]
MATPVPCAGSRPIQRCPPVPSNSCDPPGRGSGSFPFHLRQEHIADALGLTKVQVSRTLQGRRHEGLLEIDRQTATILDFRGLRGLTDYSETPAQERY